jgi:hypothetical protein
VHENEGIHLICDPNQVLALYEHSGAFCYTNLQKLNNPDYQPDLPTLESAAEIATTYLKENHWMPENAVLDNIKPVAFEQIQQRGKTRRHSTLPNHICVDYRLEIDGQRTYGPGAKIKVHIGKEGEIIGLLHAVRPIRRYAEAPAWNPATLASLLSRKLGFPLDKVEVRNVTRAYFAESYALNSRFVQPCYIFHLAVPVQTKRQSRPVTVEFLTHPIPASAFGPIAVIDAPRRLLRLAQGDTLRLACKITGGTPPYKVRWSSDFDGLLSEEPVLETRHLSVAHRHNRLTSHTIQAVVTDANGLQDIHQVLVRVGGRRGVSSSPRTQGGEEIDPFVGVEWCNLYHGSAPDISGTDPSARGFKNGLINLAGWTSRFDWGNDNAWEEDFKIAAAPGGGTDSNWSDNVHFAFFAGHGSSGAFYFGSTVDDHQMVAADARWGDGLLNWIVLHACNTMMNNFAWDVWCDAFIGLHQMFGFHTTTEGSDPPLGSRLAFWLSWHFWPWMDAFDMRTAWRLACSECFDSSVEYSNIYANQSGTDTQNDHLPGYGHVSGDPTSPNVWVYTKGSC